MKINSLNPRLDRVRHSAGVSGDANGVTKSGGDEGCEALVGGTEGPWAAADMGVVALTLGVRALEENPDASARCSGGFGYPSASGVSFHRIPPRYLLYREGLTKLVTPIRGDMFAALTIDFPNQPLRNFLLCGLVWGFALPAVFPEERHVVVSNHASATAFHPTAADQLRVNSAQEVALGRRSGPFTVAEAQQFPVFSNAPVGAVQKEGAPDGTVDQLYQGVLLEGMVFVDHALMFGIRDAGFHCCNLGNWYSDNFFGAVPEGMEARTIAQVRRVFGLVGYNLKLEVLFGTAIRVLGFLVNTRSQTVLLELSRRKEICKLLLEAAGSKVMTAHRVSVVAGKLTWVRQVLYLSNVYGLLGAMDRPRRPVVVVPVAVREVLEWFADTLLEWAGLEYIREQGRGSALGIILVGAVVPALRWRHGRGTGSSNVGDGYCYIGPGDERVWVYSTLVKSGAGSGRRGYSLSVPIADGARQPRDC
ncbi:hypothetical protein BC829DRAFT_415110 [Chytridium lagenaria]|nr:hypothetical protein BC829DRAFT_415110 [Chytridium lagenaria]